MNPEYWRDVLIATDPGWTNLRRAARATLAAILAAWLLFHLTRWLHAPRAVAFVGVFVAILGSIFVNDTKPAQQRVTMLLVPVVAGISVALGALTAPVWWLNDLVFLFFIFIAVFIRQLGPRFLSLGFILFLAYFMSIFSHARFADTPWLLAGIATGSALAYGLRFWLWPDRPELIFEQMLKAFRAQLRRICWELALGAQTGRWTRWNEQRVRKSIGELAGLALSLESQAHEQAGPERPVEGDREWRQWVLQLELSVESMAEAVQTLASSKELPPSVQLAILRSLQAVRHALGDTGGKAEPFEFEQLAAEVNRVGAVVEEAAARVALERLAEAVRDFEWVRHPPRPPEAGAPLATASAHSKAHPARHSKPPAEAGAGSRENRRGPIPPPQGAEHAAQSKPALGRHFTVRRALQATVAGAMAIAAGEALSRQRWYWAVIASFVVFARTSTSGDTLVKAIQRVVGTLIGVAVGLGLGEAVRGQRWLEIVLVFACIFFAYLLIRISYAWTVIWFTLLLSVLYSWMGLLTPGLLELRLWMTLLGAAAGVLAAVVILPVRTDVQVRQAAIAVLWATSHFLDRVLAGKTELPDEPTALTRELDQKLQALREATAPWQWRFLPVGGREQEELVQATLAAAFFARQLVRALPPEPLQRASLQEPASRLSANAGALARALQGQGAAALSSVAPLLNEFARRLGSQAPGTDRNQWMDRLRQIDEELLRAAHLAKASS